MGDPEHDKLVAPADFDGPTKNRHCTDILFLLLIFAMWAAMTGVGIHSVREGDYRLVVFPLDYDGNICGTDYNGTDMTDYPYLYYVNTYTGGVCVKECPTVGVNDTSDGVTDIRTLITYAGMFQVDGSELPTDYVDVFPYSGSDAIACTVDNCFPNNDPAQSFTSEGINEGFGYAYYIGDTYPLLSRCYLTIAAEKRIEELVSSGGGLDVADSAYDFWNKLYGDLFVARKYIGIFGFGVSFAVSMTYIFLMRMPILLNALIWTSIAVTIGVFFVAGYYSWSLANDWNDSGTVDDRQITVARAASIILYILGTILVVLTCCLRTQIQLAIGCVKEAGRAVNNMLLILLVPFVQTLGFFAFMVVWLYYAVHLVSLGTIRTTEVPLDFEGNTQVAFRTYEFDDFVENCAWYLLFCLYWTANFIIAVGDLTIAMCVAKWYFARNKITIGSWTVLTSLWHTLVYHLGTCAYGSLIIAIIQVIRTMIAKAQKHAKEANTKIAQCILCCCQCFFCCLEACMKFLSKNAYVQTAIFSTAFCKSCRNAFFLILRNAARIAAVSYVSAAVLIVGKLFISTVTTALAYYFIAEDIEEELYSIGGPIAVVFLMSYWLSDMFLDVWVRDYGESARVRGFFLTFARSGHGHHGDSSVLRGRRGNVRWRRSVRREISEAMDR